MHAQLGQIMNNKLQKDQNRTATSEMWGAKAGYCALFLHTTSSKGWVDYVGHLSSVTSGPLPSLHLRDRLMPLPTLTQGASKGICC